MAATESLPQSTVPPAWRRVGRNSVWLLLARGLGQVLGLAFALLVARNLGEVILGQFAFISTVLLIANMATNLGTDTLIIRQVASVTDDLKLSETEPDTSHSPLLTSALLIQLSLSSSFIVAIWLFGGLLPNQTADTIPAFRIISLSLLPIALSSVLSAVLRGREHMGLYLIFTLVTSAILVIGAGTVVLNSGGLFGLAVTSLVAQTVGALAAIGLFRGLRPQLAWRLSWPSPDLIRGMVRAGIVLALLMTVTLLIGRLGTLILSLLGDDAATGWFAAAARLVEGFKLIPAAVLGALFPVLARRHARPESSPTETGSAARLRRILLISVALALAIAALITLLAGPLITGLYGPEYAPSILTLQILIWSLPFSVVALSLSMWLVAADQERLVLGSLLPVLVLSAVLTVGLVSRWGLTGAAVGSLAAELLQMIALLIAVKLAPTHD